jgi:hypothetical protein
MPLSGTIILATVPYLHEKICLQESDPGQVEMPMKQP